MSTSSLTPVATGTTSVWPNEPVIRFQRAVELDLQVRDLERRVQRLARQLGPNPQPRQASSRQSRRSAWRATA